VELDDLYQELILDHYKHPRCSRSIPDGEAMVDEENPTCGDRIKLNARVADGRVADLEIDCSGCAICTASASMMAERARGMSVEAYRRLSRDFVSMMRGGPDLPDETLGDLAALRGVRQFPVRVKCATMAWRALDAALDALGV
jgi:nitrogen fixation NifU-like protein